MQMYLCSSTLSQISLKIRLGKWFFKFWSRDYFRETKIRVLAAILKRNILRMLFLLIYVFLGVYRYGASFVPKFLPEST